MANVTSDTDKGAKTRRIEVASGETTPWYFVARECTVVGAPGSGGTVTAEATYSLPSIVAADNAGGSSNALAIPWTAGASNTTKAEALVRATAVRFAAAGAAAVCEIAG